MDPLRFLSVTHKYIVEKDLDGDVLEVGFNANADLSSRFTPIRVLKLRYEVLTPQNRCLKVCTYDMIFNRIYNRITISEDD